MAFHLTMRCAEHDDPFECPDTVVVRSRSGAYGLPIHDGGSSSIAITHCPWCGTDLAAF